MPRPAHPNFGCHADRHRPPPLVPRDPGNPGSDASGRQVARIQVRIRAGSSFIGWGGICGGTGACALVLTQAVTFTATFNAQPPTYTLYLPMITKGAAPITSQGARAGPDASGAILPGRFKQRGKHLACSGQIVGLTTRGASRAAARVESGMRIRAQRDNTEERNRHVVMVVHGGRTLDRSTLPLKILRVPYGMLRDLRVFAVTFWFFAGSWTIR